ncbi:bifunctional metallophosphatase/5'-nucleotidase, partial [bacterium LRH843]|nr:bifunctional metallophosphatase/5'-nucleotidase [bacterium LRH843]
TEFSAGGFPRVAAKIAEREAALDNVLKLHAGDAITGTLYFTSFEGEADAQLMNQVCFDAFALGNHEFDRGDAGLKSFLDMLD